MSKSIGGKSAAFKSGADASNVIPFPKLTEMEADALKWAKAFTSLPSAEQRALLFRGRITGYPSSLVAFKQPLRPRSAGSATPGEDDAAPYVEAAVERILDKLRHCPPKSQDTTINTVAFELNRLIAGNWLGTSEHDLKARFLQACGTLSDVKSSKGKWTPRHFEEKWQNAKRDASTQPKPWPPKTFRGGGGGANAPNTLDLGLKLLSEAEPLTGTLGERYFRDARGVDPDRAELHLFFHPAASCSELGKGKTMPAVLAAYRTSPEGEPVAVHVTYIGANGSKPSLEIRKRTFGHWKDTGAALYLMPVGERTIVAEGIEKALACGAATGLPAIAAGSTAP